MLKNDGSIIIIIALVAAVVNVDGGGDAAAAAADDDADVDGRCIIFESSNDAESSASPFSPSSSLASLSCNNFYTSNKQ